MDYCLTAIKKYFVKKYIIAALLCITSGIHAQQIVLENDLVQRTLSFDGKVWRTNKFVNKKDNYSLVLKSDEFAILPMGEEKLYSISDFTVIDQPLKGTTGDTSYIIINYKPRPETRVSEALPQLISIKYYIVKGEAFIRKNISLVYDKPATVDRLEVERFIVIKEATGGGRGEPVFVNKQWYFGLEYPAGYSRHTDGNTPKAFGRSYDSVGNYSFISLEGRDVEPHPAKGMIRLMHFPGYAIATAENKFQLTSKISIAGSSINSQSIEVAFMNYLSTVWKSSRSFLHYNNWFEPKAKDLSGDGLIDIFRSFKKAISPYGIKMDAMVVDDGWQDRKSIWEPSPKYFPNGYKDVKLLSQKLKNEGVGFGLWLSLNGYTNNIDWGVERGYKEAQRNKYFSRYGRNYSLSATQYKNEVLKKIPFIAKETGAIYYKHDFNVLSDSGEGNNHPATDRHGHEASMDAAIEILLATKKLNPDIYQNLTNWVWFSPWWLNYADYIWMLAGDDGTNGNWPEISTRAMSSTDRDTYIWRMWGNPNDRPLVPISRLMTHGIIKTSNGRMESKEDNLQDWLDYVLMHYGRGTLLKEWYISPEVLNPEHWKALCTVHNWATAHEAALNNTVFIGGRPDEGNAYGYIGWDGDKAVLVARNTQANPQKIIIPFNPSTGFNQSLNKSYFAKVVYPYQDIYPTTFISGKTIEIILPGYATMAFELQKGVASKSKLQPKKIQFTTNKNGDHPYTSVVIPTNLKGRYDLLVIGYPSVPKIIINGDSATSYRKSKAAINKFANYAKAGMPSDKAKAWNMIAIDLSKYAGKTIKIEYGNAQGFECYLLAEQTVNAPLAIESNNLLWPITNNTRRQTIRLY
jgi:hypothetical protein